MVFRGLLVLISSHLFVACSGTTVVLIPDAAGKVGQVTVTTEKGTTLLSKAYESSEASNLKNAPSNPDQLTKQNTYDMFSETLVNEPKPPKRYALYFETASAELNIDGRTIISIITKDIQHRKLCDLSVIGHTDRVWDNENNLGLSLQRAKNVADALTKNGIESKCMDIRYYGENDPAIPTEDDVAEPLNRRVEVEVR